MATCRKCGKNPAKDRVCLARVNEIGVLPAIWECRPSCDAKLRAEECVLLAIEGDSGRGVRAADSGNAERRERFNLFTRSVRNGSNGTSKSAEQEASE